MPTKIHAGRREKELQGRSRRSSTNSTDEFLSAKAAASQSLLSVLPKLPLQTVQKIVKKKAKEMSKTLCHTCLPTALTTKTKPPNDWNKKKIIV